MTRKAPASIIEKLNKLRWPEGKSAAFALEEELRERIIIEPLSIEPRLVAGVDAAFFGDKIVGAACLFTFPELKKVAEAHRVVIVKFPYIPGLLSFREGPAVIEALRALPDKPDLLIFDGQGIAHPRGLGIASFVGAALDIPSIGTAKSRLIGTYSEPGPRKGDVSPLNYEGHTIGAVVRTRNNTRPLFVSPGHRIDVKGSVDIVLGMVSRFRLAEPVRCADKLSKYISGELKGQRKSCKPADM